MKAQDLYFGLVDNQDVDLGFTIAITTKKAWDDSDGPIINDEIVADADEILDSIEDTLGLEITEFGSAEFEIMGQINKSEVREKLSTLGLTYNAEFEAYCDSHRDECDCDDCDCDLEDEDDFGAGADDE